MATGRILPIAALIGLLVGGGPGWAQSVGTTGAVNPASTGTPPGGSTRTLEIGSDVVYRERIRTTAGGSLQVLFVDTSTMTIGPNSDITIDEFVYDPNAGTGRFVTTLAKGTLRFVGGQISHNQGATINTPQATVGIRGGVALVTETTVVCAAGACTVDPVTPNIPPVTLRAGEGVQVGAGGTQQFTPTTGAVQSFTTAITTAGGGDAGAAPADLNASSRDPGAGGGGEPGGAGSPGTTGPAPVDLSDIDEIEEVIEELDQESEPDEPDEPERPDPPPPPPPPEN